VSEQVRIAIAGAGGRMGQTLIEAVLATPDLALGAAIDVASCGLIGRDAGERFGRATGVIVGSDVASAIGAADVLIDFTRPAGTMVQIATCAKAGVAAVIGTTGLSQPDRRALDDFARAIPIVYAPNMSVGVTVLTKLVEIAAQRLGNDYDIEIVEMHHRAKIDAPSGTALMLGQAAAAGRRITLDQHAVRGRDGITGARQTGDIGFASLRGGTMTGDHSVIFAGAMERIELTHRAEDRTMFAQGAIKAALWARDKKPGLYSMADVLGLKDF